MHIPSDPNPINPTRAMTAAHRTPPVEADVRTVHAKGEADFLQQGLLAELTSELKRMPEVRPEAVVSAARDIQSIDLKQLGSLLATELNRFESTDSK